MSKLVVPGKTPTFGLRLPSELKQRLEEQAKAEGRSLNSEIVKRLKESFSGGA